LKSEAGGADKAKEAIECTYSWAQSHQGEFFGRENGHRPFSGYAGRWDKEEAWQSLGFFPDRLQKVLEERDFEYDAVLRTWKDRGWIETDKEKGKRRFSKKTRVDGTSARLIMLRRDALEEPEDHTEDAACDATTGKDQDTCVSLNPEDFVDSDEFTEVGTWEHSGNVSGNIH
jgi:hypothetical protein